MSPGPGNCQIILYWFIIWHASYSISLVTFESVYIQVSQELIRMAILWHEMWHEALEEASRQYFGESNVEAMLSTLMPLHEMMQANGGITLKEIAFVKVPFQLLASAV